MFLVSEHMSGKYVAAKMENFMQSAQANMQNLEDGIRLIHQCRREIETDGGSDYPLRQWRDQRMSPKSNFAYRYNKLFNKSRG